MRVRRATLRGVAAIVTLGLLVASGTAGAAPRRPKSPKPNLGVAEVLNVPAEALVGASFGVKVLMGNDGEGAAGRSRLSLHLSRDERKSRGDLTVGSESVPRVGAWKTRLVPADVKVPSSAKGKYYVLACADARRAVRERREGDNCRASRSMVQIVRPLDGKLVGTLDFYDSGSTNGETWDRFAQAKVTMLANGHGTDIRIVDDNSSYSWMGNSTFTNPLPGCPTTKTEDEQKIGDFVGLDPRLPNLRGSASNAELSQLRLVASMDYDVTGTMTSCTGSVPYAEGREYTTSLDLTQVSETATTITYRVSASYAGDDGGQPSQWDNVTGNLTLRTD